MKYLPKLLLITIAICLFTACSKSNDAPSGIVGTWNQTSDSVKQYQNGSLTSVLASQPLLNIKWQFTNKGILNDSENGTTDASPYKATADSLFIYVPARVEYNIPQAAYTISWQIQTLTQHQLVLTATQNSFTQINLQQTVPAKTVTLFYFTR